MRLSQGGVRKITIELQGCLVYFRRRAEPGVIRALCSGNNGAQQWIVGGWGEEGEVNILPIFSTRCINRLLLV